MLLLGFSEFSVFYDFSVFSVSWKLLFKFILLYFSGCYSKKLFSVLISCV